VGNKTNLKSASPDTLLTQPVTIEPGWRTSDLERRSLIRSLFAGTTGNRPFFNQSEAGKEEPKERPNGSARCCTEPLTGRVTQPLSTCLASWVARLMYGYSGHGKSLNDHRLLSVASTSHVAPNAATSAPSQNSEQSQGDNK
jgi:hypothetical protein